MSSQLPASLSVALEVIGDDLDTHYLEKWAAHLKVTDLLEQAFLQTRAR